MVMPSAKPVVFASADVRRLILRFRAEAMARDAIKSLPVGRGSKPPGTVKGVHRASERCTMEMPFAGRCRNNRRLAGIHPFCRRCIVLHVWADGLPPTGERHSMQENRDQARLCHVRKWRARRFWCPQVEMLRMLEEAGWEPWVAFG